MFDLHPHHVSLYVFLQTYFNSMEQTMHPTADEKEDNCHNA